MPKISGAQKETMIMNGLKKPLIIANEKAAESAIAIIEKSWAQAASSQQYQFNYIYPQLQSLVGYKVYVFTCKDRHLGPHWSQRPIEGILQNYGEIFYLMNGSKPIKIDPRFTFVVRGTNQYKSFGEIFVLEGRA